MRERRVVVTGLGAVSGLGLGKQAVVDGVRAGRGGIGPIEQFDATGFEHTRAGEVRGFDPADHLRDPGRWGRSGQFAAAAARMAAADSDTDPEALAAGRVASCFGTTNGESQVLERLAEHVVAHGPGSAPPELAGRADAGRIAAAVATELCLTGETLTFGTACAAANYAIGYAFDLVRAGDADAALCGGADAANRSTHAGFHRLGALARDVPRPFDKDRDGIVTAEGGVALLLEPLDAALDRGARIYAEVLGYGMTCDARHMTNPDAASIAACIRVAQHRAGVKPEEVDYICAHGTGTRANEAAEVAAVRAVFGERIPPISSVKSLLGHTMGAAAGFGALVSCAAVHDGFLPPTATLRERDPELGPGLDCVPAARTARVRIAQNHGFAFGGNNAITLFGEVAA
ncbi:beta-ketoacyl-[acyl-carrier-protein] synthase family protein [Amycolatopsis anabasis]|uniref:beta-ketoacyl-[acyl-carrier-protein] synthase family protein n=1 Tax=Amycolatopsis anabasis TaxID=1840409 RepID=UPI00131D2186|nr:beta-ketoacyl-[acyl-carrier-protein] synthase family protein [Amycolatopsis anabasis]